MPNRFRVVIFSGADPAVILQLIARIHREVPEAHVCGVLSERRPRKSFSTRAASFVRNLRDWNFVAYAASKTARSVLKLLARAGTAVLRFVHGGGPLPRRVEDPSAAFRALDCSFRVTTDYHSDDSLDYVRSLRPDLGLVYGTRILKRSLFAIPRLGSINIHKRKVPDYRGGGPVGLWEMLDDQTEIGVTVHQVTEELDAGAIVRSADIPIEPYDDLTSLALKADLVGNELLAKALGDFARGTLNLRPQSGRGRTYKNPTPHQLAAYERALSKRRPGYRAVTWRPASRLILKTLVALPRIAIRNWKCRLTGTFPVAILFHHLVSDRPHRMGISTTCFLKHVEFLQKYYHLVSLGEAVEMLKAKKVARPTVVLTFDDGYRDNFINARAVVERTRVPVAMFVSTGHITDQKEFGHDLDSDIRGFMPLTWEQVLEMEKDGFEIGSHTRTHFDCGSRDLAQLAFEIAGPKEDLERRLGQPVQFFSFPFGLPENISPEAARLAAATYPYIFSAYGGSNVPAGNGGPRHLKRWCHSNHLWELELMIQSALEREPSFQLPAIPDGVFDDGAVGRSAA
jgi:peptidoglycan/xylan/chitin deacetylase (PgdA/CDA1 family)/folate-dependent phosphoribosylglycinamide formyltransferase PurN